MAERQTKLKENVKEKITSEAVSELTISARRLPMASHKEDSLPSFNFEKKEGGSTPESGGATGAKGRRNCD